MTENKDDNESGNEGHDVAAWVPSSRAELGLRLKYVIESVGGYSNAAELTHKSVMQLRRYVSGENDPPFQSVAYLAAASGFSLHWLAYGEGGERVGADAPSGGVPVGAANVDKHLLSRAIEGVRKVYQRHKVHLPTINEAELAIDIHDRVVAVATADDERRGALLMALDQLDRKLASTITDETSDKRSVCG